MNIQEVAVYSRLRFGSILNGELQALSGASRRVAEYLNGLPPEERGPGFNAYLASRDDRDEFAKAIDDDDPSGPFPEAESGDGAEAHPLVRMRRAADIEPLAVEWLWRDRVARGMLSLFAGDPKLGKLFVTLGMAASVSRGVALPGDDPPEGPGSAILLSAEDDPARTIVPRLKA